MGDERVHEKTTRIYGEEWGENDWVHEIPQRSVEVYKEWRAGRENKSALPSRVDGIDRKSNTK